MSGTVIPSRWSQAPSSTGTGRLGGVVYKSSDRILLPEAREQSMADPRLVRRVTRQLSGKQALLVKQPPHQDGQHERRSQEAPVGTQRQRRPYHIEQRAGVH